MPSSTAALTIYLFGASAFAAGLYGLFDPSAMATRLALAPPCLPSLRGNALASLAMGLYYGLAAYQENRAFFVLSVPMRFLTTAVFARQGWTSAAVWEGAGAALTAVALIIGRDAERVETKPA